MTGGCSTRLWFAQVRKDTLEGIVQQLPDATEVVVPVMAEVHRRCTGHKEHLAESALALCALAPNKAVVVSLWQFYLDTLLENAGGVLGSKNAAEFTFTRLKAHGSRLRLFLNDDSNREVALDIAGELRFERDLSGVYNLIQQVSRTNGLADVCRKGLRHGLFSPIADWHEGVLFLISSSKDILMRT